MIYNIKKGTWFDLSTVVVSAPANNTEQVEYLPKYFGHAITMGRDFLIWNQGGIVQYSPDDNRVVWSAKAINLQDVALDGPYLWIRFVARPVAADDRVPVGQAG
jgi:hypothetical protein